MLRLLKMLFCKHRDYNEFRINLSGIGLMCYWKCIRCDMKRHHRATGNEGLFFIRGDDVREVNDFKLTESEKNLLVVQYRKSLF